MTVVTQTNWEVYLNAQFPDYCTTREVEYWFYESVDLTKKSLTAAAANVVLQGTLYFFAFL